MARRITSCSISLGLGSGQIMCSLRTAQGAQTYPDRPCLLRYTPGRQRRVEGVLLIEAADQTRAIPYPAGRSQADSSASPSPSMACRGGGFDLGDRRMGGAVDVVTRSRVT